MDITEIRKLIKLMKEATIGEIEVKKGDESIRIKQLDNHHFQYQTTPQYCAPVSISEEQIARMPSTTTVATTITTPQPCDGKNTINSPMVGTFYLTSSPGGKAFVEVGQRIKRGDVLCIVEAMKMFNQIESDRGGIVKAILVETGQPVEYDQPLFVIEAE
ncbi:MAG: acetyl-CoA carboxylase, biotin carboxyl carrier protein [Gammaproteobacteria bacterium GWE2_42_36]|nr:MAG: acetyl-CoA carboxylase, biotin carboxyl carrier protein [Gammaproteobacteria bacterium GWE2_42_36]HCU04834.1 acetyl-CoA carboxylase biotin carboxyl carrier protein [Coxiellaceae bacterium]